MLGHIREFNRLKQHSSHDLVFKIWRNNNTEATLKVKCNEIWTIFLFSKNLHKKVSYTNRKQSQLLNLSLVRTTAPKTRKSDDFRELHENEPEMAALGVETKL